MSGNADFEMLEFHDATLEGIELLWESGEVRLRIRTGEVGRASRVIVASEVRRLECDRAMTWGFSVSINQAHAPVQIGAGLWSLEIEMQSGDIIRVDAGAFAVS